MLSNFTHYNTLNGRGQEHYWIHLDRAIEIFDYTKDDNVIDTEDPIAPDNKSTHGMRIPHASI